MSEPTPVTVTAVLNNRESLVQVQLPAKSGKQGTAAGPLLNFLPGMNFIPSEQWALAKQNPTVQHLLTQKQIAMKAPEHNPEKVGLPVLEEGPSCSKDNPLHSLAESDAVAMIDELFDVPTMKRFLEQEDRPKVAASLKSQIAKIEKTGTGKKK